MAKWWSRHAVFLLVFAISAWYAAANLSRGWVPHDDGALAQGAVRVLAGELPHRDFIEIYSGGLDYLHALVFLLFGKTLMAMRYVLFAAYLLWLPAIYWIALQFARPPAAAATTLLAAIWSIPFYSASMPSWYNLFLASYAIVFLFLYQQDPQHRSRWMLLAGLCCGLSTIIKVTGLYSLAAALLACVYFLHRTESSAPAFRKREGSSVYEVFVLLSLMLFVFGVIAEIRSRLDYNATAAFLVPCIGVAVLAARAVLQDARQRTDRQKFISLMKILLPLATGFIVPILILLLPYLFVHSAGSLFRGALVIPFRRLGVTVVEPTYLVATLPALLLILFILAAAYFKFPKWVQFTVCAAMLYGCFLATRPGVLQFFWHSAFDSVPYLSLAAFCMFWKRPSNHDWQVFALCAFVACCNLSRFPFYHAIYFCYLAPLVIVCFLAIVAHTPRESKVVLTGILLLYAALALFRVKPGFSADLGQVYARNRETVPFQIERARGIRTDRETVAEYEAVIRAVQLHSRSQYIFAAPDSPEIYFMAGEKNPTPEMFDFLDERLESNITAALYRYPIEVVVLKKGPQFSRLPDVVRERVERKFTHRESFQNFEVRWK